MTPEQTSQVSTAWRHGDDTDAALVEAQARAESRAIDDAIIHECKRAAERFAMEHGPDNYWLSFAANMQSMMETMNRLNLTPADYVAVFLHRQSVDYAEGYGDVG